MAPSTEIISRFATLVRDLRRVIALLRDSAPRLTILGAALTLGEVFLAISVLYVIKLLIDVLSGGRFVVDEGNVSTQVFLYLGLAGGALLLAVVMQSLASLVRKAQGMRVGEYVDRSIHERAIAVDLGFYESPEYFDSLQRARQAGIQRPAQVVNSLLLIGKSGVFLLGVLIMIAGIDWRILPAILVVVTAVLVVRLRFTKRLFIWQRERVPMERQAGYLDWLLTSDQHAKELRIGGLGHYFQNAYGNLRKRINTQHLRIETQRTWAEFLASALGAIVFACATAFLVFEAAASRQTVGDLVLFVLLFRRAETSGRELVSNTSRLYDDRLYLQQLFEFLAVRPTIVKPVAPSALPDMSNVTLKAENVCFRYPGSDKFALENIDIEINAGQVVALVGENGSGKTSLVKILTRLYDPVSGSVSLNGTNIRNFEPSVYRRAFSVIFQDFARYANTVKENIRFGDVDAEVKDGAVEYAGQLAEADEFVQELPKGYNTPLTRMFEGGQEISIGQWQRVALARAFFPSSSFIIMDEPTSALDPEAEFELFRNFRKRLGGRGALLISHRLSSVRKSDYVYVLDQGKIVEHGTHDELVVRNGKYAELFGKQRSQYTD